MSGPIHPPLCRVDQIMEVMQAAFDPAWGEAWNRRQIEDSLAMPNVFVLLVDSSGDLVNADAGASGLAAGFVLARHAPGEEELLLIAVRPEFRRRGIGEALIRQLAQDARARGAERIFLEMRENNPASSLYHKVGFEPIGRRKAYYLFADGTRMDAITFGLSI
ncbi:GNAT family N-acetyltransferase [Erythrobacteraceae bacterium 1XM1-14]|uniref:GNAT family N-acetyltransferase n=2 Tax=Altererythrobacter litoralis TaxID=3113904 RepID=A0ABU7GE93_9SPHN|nr:GNAT family N-acetyltransferase [Erythrobacteraceae bacterium 1XM1-14]